MNTELGKKSVDQAPAGGQSLPEKDAVPEDALDGVTGGLKIYDPTGCYPPLQFRKPPAQALETKE